MDYTLKSKPTYYNGNKYRSRLEARWAAFFDLIGWKYQYEIHDFPGWTPDFVIYGKNHIIVEIKPFIDESIIKDYEKRVAKLAIKEPCFIFSPDFDADSYGGILAGYRLNDDCGVTPYHWKDKQNGINSEYDIGSMLTSYDGVLWDDVKMRKVFIDPYHYISFHSFYGKWLDAGTLTSFNYGRVD